MIIFNAFKIRFLLFFIVFFGILSCNQNPSKKMQTLNAYSFYTGSYTNQQSKGIYKYTVYSDGNFENHGLMAACENPSFLEVSYHGQFLLATNEVDLEGSGVIESYAIHADTLKFISREFTAGAHPCHVSINDNNYVLTSNYSGGNVALHQLNTNGKLGDFLDTANHYGSGQHPRQDAPHAHSAWFVPQSNEVIAVDLGTNELWFYTLDTSKAKLISTEQQKLAMEPEAGPRHLCFHPNGKWIYVLNELNNTICLVNRNSKGIYTRGTSVSTLPDDFTEFSKAAHILISNDGNFIYASNRGHNSIAVFKVNQESGQLDLIEHVSTKGNSPRHFALTADEKIMVVANQDTDNLVSYVRNKKNGELAFAREIEAFSPTCVAFTK